MFSLFCYNEKKHYLIRKNPMSTNNKIFACISIMICCFLGAFIFHCYSSNIQDKSYIIQSTSTSKSVASKKIQDIRVGDRTTGVNPELSTDDRTGFLPDPIPETWNVAVFEMKKSDGSHIDFTLLRPVEWFTMLDAESGKFIFIDLPEMGIQGEAKLLRIEPCSPIKPGKGNVVTGTFKHLANGTIDLYVEGLSKPIGCTGNHPFWSVTRQEFIDAGKLLPDEELLLHDGQKTKVVQILPRPGPRNVYNIEVLNEHVYEVGWSGILVHNTCEYFHANRQNGRIESVDATVTPSNLRSGTRPSDNARVLVNTDSIDDAGHIIAKVLGGSGSNLDNIVSLGRTLNRGKMATFEKNLAASISSSGATAKIKIEFEYNDTKNPTRPTSLTYKVDFEGPVKPGSTLPSSISEKFNNPIQTQ
jgi:hypothetical protein